MMFSRIRISGLSSDDILENQCKDNAFNNRKRDLGNGKYSHEQDKRTCESSGFSRICQGQFEGCCDIREHICKSGCEENGQVNIYRCIAEQPVYCITYQRPNNTHGNNICSKNGKTTVGKEQALK